MDYSILLGSLLLRGIHGRIGLNRLPAGGVHALFGLSLPQYGLLASAGSLKRHGIPHQFYSYLIHDSLLWEGLRLLFGSLRDYGLLTVPGSLSRVGLHP